MAENEVDPINAYVGSRVAQARSAAGLSRSDLAECLGLSRKSGGQQLYLVEKGVQGVSLHRLFELAEVFGITVSQLLDEDLTLVGMD